MGAALESYSLDGKKGALVVLDPKALEVVSSSSRALPGGAGLASEFVAKLPAVAGAADPSAAQWISASGPMKADGVRPAIHTSFGDGVVDLRSAPNAAALKASAPAPAPAPTPEQLAASKLRRRRLHSAHAWLMFLAWGVLVPAAVGVAAACRGLSLRLGGGLAAPGGDASVVRGAAGGRPLPAIPAVARSAADIEASFWDSSSSSGGKSAGGGGARAPAAAPPDAGKQLLSLLKGGGGAGGGGGGISFGAPPSIPGPPMPLPPLQQQQQQHFYSQPPPPQQMSAEQQFEQHRAMLHAQQQERYRQQFEQQQQGGGGGGGGGGGRGGGVPSQQQLQQQQQQQQRGGGGGGRRR